MRRKLCEKNLRLTKGNVFWHFQPKSRHDTLGVRVTRIPGSVKAAFAMIVAYSVGIHSVQAKIIALDIDIVIDQAAPEESSQMGKHHEARIFYDDAMIDPATHRVKLLHEQHTPMLIPKHLDPLAMPMGNAWLDLSAKPYRYHYGATPVSASWPWPYTVLFDEQTMRMTLRRQSDGVLMLSGSYVVKTSPITGPEIDDVVASSEPPRNPWDKGPPMMRPPGAPANPNESKKQ
jgi:hypothetical protein